MQQTGGYWPGVETSGDDFFRGQGPDWAVAPRMYACMYLTAFLEKVNAF